MAICKPCNESRHRMCEGGDCECPKRGTRHDPKPERPYTLKMTKGQAVSLHFAMLNYRLQLRSEIDKPTRPHGQAESAMALSDLEELESAFKEQVKL